MKVMDFTEIRDCLEMLSDLGGFAPIVERDINMAGAYGGLAAAQRLWSLALAAAEGRYYAELVPGDQATVGLLRHVAVQMQELIARRLTPAEAPARPRHQFSRFLLCLDYLPGSNRYGSHLHQVCCYAAALASLPETEAVLVIATGETMPEGNAFSRWDARVTPEPSAGWVAELAQVGDPIFTRKIGFYSPTNLGQVKPLAAAVDAALRFRPDITLYFLGHLRSRLMPRLLRDIAPQVAIQLNAGNDEPTDCDLVLSQGRGIDFGAKPTPALWASHTVPAVPLRSEGGGEPLPPLPRAAFRIVTALSNGRIEHVLTEQNGHAERIEQFLEENPLAAFVLAGVERAERIVEQRPKWRALIDGGRILTLGYTSRLRELYVRCDLYAHLPGLGGGGMGIAMAIAEGLPVIVAADTDAANFVADEAVYCDSQEAFALIESLMRDPRARAALAARQMRALESHSVHAVGQRLKHLLPRAQQHFAERQAAVQPDRAAMEPGS